MRAFFDKLAGQQQISHREMVLTSVMALIVMALVTWVSSRFLSHNATPYIVASMGASTVLLLAVPSSPMNRSWPLLASHLVSAFIGVSCILYVPNQFFAIPLAVAAAMLAMYYLRCLHPPGGATAMLTVLAGPEVAQLGYQFVLTPVFLNAVLLWCASRASSRLLAIHQRKAVPESPLDWPDTLTANVSLKPPFTATDLHNAMKEMDTFIDVNEDDLMRLYHRAHHDYHARRLGGLHCYEVMISNPVVAKYNTPLKTIWGWLGKFRVTAVPVIDNKRHVIGIVALEDFIEQSRDFPQQTKEGRIQALIKPTPGSGKLLMAGEVMSQPVITAPDNALIAELLPLLDDRKIHHLPIVDEKGQLAGVLHRNQIAAVLQGKATSATS